MIAVLKAMELYALNERLVWYVIPFLITLLSNKTKQKNLQESELTS